MRLAALVGLAALGLVLVDGAAAQGEELPTELWAEYPLVPDIEPVTTPRVGPFLPPSDAVSDPVSDGATPVWSVVALVAAGLVLALLATRLAGPALTAPRGRRGRPVQLRPPAERGPRPSVSAPLGQYAPSPTPVVADAPPPVWRSVYRRTGLLRSWYVVLEGRSVDDQKPIATSRTFWRVGGTEMRDRGAEEAWDELMNDLRASGWEPEGARRSPFYVVLRPVPPDASIVPTIDAYGPAQDDDS